MVTIRLNFQVDAPLQMVWAFGLALDRIPDWQPDIVKVKNILGETGQVGVRYTLVYRIAGLRYDSQVEVKEIQPEQLIRIQGRMPIGGCFTSFTVMEPSGIGTDVQYQYLRQFFDLRIEGS